MGDYLNRFEWDHVATLTYQESQSAERVKRDVEARWLRRTAWHAQRPLRWFYTVERGGSGLHHAHTIIWGTASLTIRQLERNWKEGLTKIECYDPTRGATWYLTKQIGDFPDYWDVSKFGWNIAPGGLHQDPQAR